MKLNSVEICLLATYPSRPAIKCRMFQLIRPAFSSFYQLHKNPALAQPGGQPESEPKDFLKEAASEPPLSDRVIKEGEIAFPLTERSSVVCALSLTGS